MISVFSVFKNVLECNILPRLCSSEVSCLSRLSLISLSLYSSILSSLLSCWSCFSCRRAFSKATFSRPCNTCPHVIDAEHECVCVCACVRDISSWPYLDISEQCLDGGEAVCEKKRSREASGQWLSWDLLKDCWFHSILFNCRIINTKGWIEQINWLLRE